MNFAGHFGTLTDADTMTPDQLDVQALMQSREYMMNSMTQSEGGTGDLRFTGKSTQSLQRSAELRGGGRMPHTMSSLGRSLGQSSDFMQSGNLTYTPSEVLDTDSLEGFRDRDMNNTMQSTGSYADEDELRRMGNTLEGTGNLSDFESNQPDEKLKSGPLQVTLTLPSMEHAASGSDDQSIDDVSEMSLGDGKN